MFGCHVVFLLICPSSCLCTADEYMIEYPTQQLLCGQQQKMAAAEIIKA